MLRAISLHKKYRSKVVVENVSLEVKRGEVVGLLGPNGAGKTTTFYMIVGITRCTSGSLLMDNVDITKLPIHKRARLGISYLPQEASIFRKLNVEQNILAVLELNGSQNKRQRLDELLDELNISHLRKSRALALSGGERRRVEIARALASSPSFILLDEPFAGVDPLAVIDVKKIIKFLATKKIGVVITDHNVRETLDVCDKAYIINQGNLLASGDTDTIVGDETVRKVYLGEQFTL